MTKDAYWFSHDSNAHSDHKMQRLMRVSGWAGYGVYWALIELLREENEAGYMLPMDSIDDLCFSLRIDRVVIDSIFESKLLESDGKMFWSQSLVDRMAIWDKKRKLRADAGRRGGYAKAQASNATAMPQQCSSNATALPQQCSGNALARIEQNRTEQNRTEQDKQNKTNRIRQNKYCPETSFELPAGSYELKIQEVLNHRFGTRLSELSSNAVKKLITNLAGSTYAGIDVPLQIERAGIWEDCNPAKRKRPRGVPRFLLGWMGRVHDSKRQDGHNGNRRGTQYDQNLEILNSMQRMEDNDG